MAKIKKTGENLAGIFDEVKNMGGLVEPSRCKLKVISIERSHDQNGLLSYSVQSQIKAPKALAGQTHFENFRVGVPSDPDAKKKSTWVDQENWGARAMRTFLDNTKMVPGFEKMAPEDALKKCNGKTFGTKFGVKTDNRKVIKKTGEPNPYFGQEQQTRSFFADDGTKKFELLAAGGVKTKPHEPDEDDDGDGDDEDDTPKSKGKEKKKKKPADDDEDNEEPDDDDGDGDEDDDDGDAEDDDDSDDDDSDDEED